MARPPAPRVRKPAWKRRVRKSPTLAPPPAPGRPAPSPVATPNSATVDAATAAAPEPRRAPQKDPDEGFIAIGRVVAPFGLKGELKVQSLTDNAQRFAPRAKLWAGDQPVSIATSRDAGSQLYITFKGFADRSSVERFRHAMLQIPEAALPTLPEGEYYRFQLIGLDVVDRDGSPLGTLDEVIETGSNDVYRVHTPDGADLLIPALDDVVLSVDLDEHRMVVDPPDWR